MVKKVGMVVRGDPNPNHSGVLAGREDVTALQGGSSPEGLLRFAGVSVRCLDFRNQPETMEERSQTERPADAGVFHSGARWPDPGAASKGNMAGKRTMQAHLEGTASHSLTPDTISGGTPLQESLVTPDSSRGSHTDAARTLLIPLRYQWGSD